MKSYDHKKIEPKWQKIWEKNKTNVATQPPPVLRTSASSQRRSAIKPKFYGLIEFPYPSGDGLHVGHIRSNTAMDIVARKRRAEGYNVLYPIGWDAFGLPTENYAIKTGKAPSLVTKENTDTFRRQLKALGFSFDWSREINTTDPAYYKWTQWIFLQFFKKGLAYKTKMPINWCLNCKIGLANEEVVDGMCERCGGPTEKREKEQWMLAITKYADRLDKDLDKVDYSDRIKIQQRNWIGRSSGTEITFQCQSSAQKAADPTQNNAEKILRPSASSQRESATLTDVKVFTTRPDTLFGATYLVVAPEHPIIKTCKDKIKNLLEVNMYIEFAGRKEEKERTDEGREKTGVKIEGLMAINPANKEEIPIYVADYVLGHYGTGAIMAVPAHDERDFEFAMQHNLPVKKVVLPQTNAEQTQTNAEPENHAYTGPGVLVNSGKFDGMDSEKAKKEITKFVGGKLKTTFKLRDWVFSRQRYWGEPIPLIFCEACAKKSKARTNADLTQKNAEEGKLNPGWFAMLEKNLPLKLPTVKKYQPTDSGESPLAAISSWVNVKCPKCGGRAKRETDTMPNWAGSSWYFLRYADPKNKKEFASKKALKYFTPVDWYNGGMEHTTLHLLYSRFWHKFLYDLKLVPTSEPYKKRTSHGLIIAEGGVKMSKSKGNVVNPDGIVRLVGADSLRLYEMFMGPFEQSIIWSKDGVVGTRRFLEKVWRLRERVKSYELRVMSKELEILLHQTIKKVSEDIESLKMNTAVSQLMILTNKLEKEPIIPKKYYKILLRLLAPFAPHLTEELWQKLGEKKSIHESPWLKWDAKKVVKKTVTIAVSVNGKIRGQLITDKEANKEEVAKLALKDKNIKKWITGPVKRQIYVPGRIINFVT
ncbi:MAG: leucine--tRNA ligase [bacterium]|nr:leucine--tRNA ligase [bacterium]